MKKSEKVTGKARSKAAEQFKRKYNNGASIAQIAQAAGRSYGFVHRVLVQSGANLRGHGGPRRGQKRLGNKG